MRPTSIHGGGWRFPGAWPDANFNFAHYRQAALTLERGRFDALFMADHLAVLNMPIEALKRSATVTSFDPLTLLPALAAVTTSPTMWPVSSRRWTTSAAVALVGTW
jgi:alkanesulfonate monooxygenase